MFQFSTFALLKLFIGFRVTALIALPGFPIQKSPGLSSFDNSPELIAVYDVFLRLSAPRHPPCALHSLISIPLLQSNAPNSWLNSYFSSLRIFSNPVQHFRHLILNSISRLNCPNIFSLSISSFLFSSCRGLWRLPHPVGEGGLYAPRTHPSNYFFKKMLFFIFARNL